MEITAIKLTQIAENEANPREIKKDKFQKLMNSVLVFPKMLGVRPIVIDSTYKALGGNQRTKALQAIAKLDIGQITDRLLTMTDYISKPLEEQKSIVQWWSDWLEDPTAPVIFADELTEDEKKQFIIKDNVSFGTWDYNELANKWDSQQLQGWGMDVWSDTPAFSSESTDEQPQEGGEDIEPEEPEDEFAGALPPELEGRDLTPDTLVKIKGDDERPNDYVVITFEPKDAEKLIALLGIKQERWTGKVCYTLDEINFMRED